MKKLILGLLMVAALPCAGDQDEDIKYYKWRESTLARMSADECHNALKEQEVVFVEKKSFLEKQVCDAKNLVRVKKFKNVEVKPAAIMTCELALKVSEWMKTSIQPEAKSQLGSDLISIRQSGTYSCRKMRTLNFISEHAFANAIDIPEFRFKNGKSLTVLKNWKKPAKESAFLKAIHKSACGLFPVALGPEYDKHHENHLHVDVGPLTLCK